MWADTGGGADLKVRGGLNETLLKQFQRAVKHDQTSKRDVLGMGLRKNTSDFSQGQSRSASVPAERLS